MRGTIQFSRRDVERVWFMAAAQKARLRGLRESLCVMDGRMSALPPEATETPASEMTIDSCIAAALARVNRWETNSRVNPARAEKLSVRSAIGRAVGGRMAAETGKRIRPLRVAALIHLRGTL